MAKIPNHVFRTIGRTVRAAGTGDPIAGNASVFGVASRSTKTFLPLDGRAFHFSARISKRPSHVDVTKRRILARLTQVNRAD